MERNTQRMACATRNPATLSRTCSGGEHMSVISHFQLLVFEYPCQHDALFHNRPTNGPTIFFIPNNNVSEWFQVLDQTVNFCILDITLVEAHIFIEKEGQPIMIKLPSTRNHAHPAINPINMSLVTTSSPLLIF